jgi:predicted TIM-barrel fold metal-dependent hydrolase
MAAADRLYSCDDHLDLWTLPRDLWQARLPAGLRERAPRVVGLEQGDFWVCDGKALGPSGGKLMNQYSAITRAGIADDGYRASTPALRLRDMDRDGVWASVIYGPSLLGLPIGDAELKAACLRAYNDWAAEFNAVAPERLSVLPVLTTQTPEAATAELERCARLGHRGAIVFVFEIDVRRAEWDRLWAAAEDTGLPISFHIGMGLTLVQPVPRSWEMACYSACCPLQLDEPLSVMIYSGALERHPKMKLVLAESGIGWIPYFVARLDASGAKHIPAAADYKLRAKPSEIFKRQVMATFEEEPLGPQLIPLVGADSFMWASDYPHPDSTFPESQKAIDEAFAGLPDEVRRKATADNCARLYGFA